MNLDAFELDDVLGGRRGRGLLSDLRTANGRIMAVFCVRVFRIVSEADCPWWGTWGRFVYVCYVHQVILEGVVVVVLQP